jgi:tetratricopeptide (TPR) repeat protein
MTNFVHPNEALWVDTSCPRAKNMPQRSPQAEKAPKTHALTQILDFAMFCSYLAEGALVKRRSIRTTHSASRSHKLLKTKALKKPSKPKPPAPDPDAPAKQAQLKFYEEALKQFQQQKFGRAKEAFERVVQGPGKELSDRALMHLRICEQRISRPPIPVLKSAEDHYTQGVALMNLGRWDEAREHLDRARKAAPKADHIVYAMAALDCLTGEADSAMQNLKVAIQLRPENRYHARNDEDFAFLQEDPRFTELLYPERDGSAG